MRLRTIVILGLAAAVATPLSAGTTTSWSAATADELAAGTLDGTSLDRDGRVRLAPERAVWFGPDDGIVWQVRAAGDDAAFVALSGPGRVLRVTAAGDAESWFRAEGEALVTALDVGADGRPVFGVSPDARIVRAAGADEHEVLAALQAAFVWAVLDGGDDGVWVGTGTPGALLRVGPDGLVETVLDTGDDPVRAIAAHPDGGVVLGTGGRGRVIRVHGDGRPFVLLDADEDEIVAVDVSSDGAIWALAAAGAKQVRSTGSVTPPGGASASVRVTATPPPPSPGNGDDDDDSRDDGERRGATRAMPQAFRLPPGGALYRIEPDGGVRRVWRTDKELPFALVAVAPDRIVVTTGDDGSVWELDREGRASRLLRIASSQASAVAAAPSGRLLVGGTTDARLEAVGAGPRDAGAYLTPAIDAGAPADWGAVVWDADIPRGAGLDVHVRAGNTEDPDETWSAWTGVTPRAGGGRAAIDGLPATRYLQVRVSLRPGRGGESPRLRRVEQFYRPRNRAPEIRAITIEPPGVVLIPAPAQAANALGPVVADDPVARRAAESLTRRRMVPMRRGWEQGARTFSWQAEDPDDDRLRFDVEIRREGDERWVPLARDVEDDHLSWDARAMPDGHYRVRLAARDDADNPEGGSLTDRRESEVFLVDNGRPTVADVRVEQTAGARLLRIDAVDAGGGVAAAEIAIDGGDWRPIDPVDGVADGAEERFVVELPSGDVRAVMIRVIDAAGNIGGTLWTP